MAVLNTEMLLAQRATATISGIVTDPSAAVLADAAVRATNVNTGVPQPTASDTQGRYRIAELPIGKYRVQVEKQGFQTAVHPGVELTVGSESIVDFTMSVGQANQTISVEGEISSVNTPSAQLSTQCRRRSLSSCR
jgi:hypothetical protein